ncbi:MAG: nucleotidyltransferase/DNA polymerase protein [Candidatus Taylorbacteria bacterium]|nr:nucleotidyltransferase/DNA polymerase protein [Candidatus Taylorbacteria bacterium]
MIKHPIIHLDGDAFFAACEIAKNPRLRGKAVVVGEDKGIATAMSYEAKRMGISRGMPVFQIRKLFPQAIVLPSDFDTYRRFSKRVMSIVRRHIARVEDYSVDECFADMSEKFSSDSYDIVARRIKTEIEASLGITFSVGVAETKVLAKLASKREKPAGFTILEPGVDGSSVREYLAQIPVGSVWGIGTETSIMLRRHGIETAGQLAALSRDRVEQSFSLPVIEIWNELNGRAVFRVTKPEEMEQRKSIQDTRSFRPPTSDRRFLFAELSHHAEEVCQRARIEGLVGSRVSFFLRTRGREYVRSEFNLDRPTSLPTEILPQIARHLDGFGGKAGVYSSGMVYKSAGVVLSGLRPAGIVQEDLFGESERMNIGDTIYRSVDAMNKRFGDRTIMLASSIGGRKERPIFLGETLPLPYLGEVF